MLLKAFAVWLLIAFVEMIHGILRAKFVAPKVGDLRSRQLAVFSGSLLIFLIAYATVPWIGPRTPNDAIQVGALWFFCMMIFEFSVGRLVFGFSWQWLWKDFSPFQGRLLLFGMMFLFLAPYMVGKIQRIF